MIILLATGGTIASVEDPSGRRVGRVGAELLAEAAKVWALPEQVEVRDTQALVSSALSAADVYRLARQCGSDHPVVITHGTDAMEETAFAISLLRGPADPPVILTGAQRPFDDPSPDGPRNLAAALSWAGADAARGTGVSVVFADEVLPAIGVRKSHTLSLVGFSAPGRGPFAVVDEAGVRKFAHPVLPATPLACAEIDIECVEVISTQLGMSSRTVDAALVHGDVALVVEGMGAGNAPPEVTARLVTAIAHGTPVVVTSRTGAGASVGLYAGGGADLLRAGAVFAGDLSTSQARWALAAALSHGREWRTRLQGWLREAGCVGVGAGTTHP